MGSLFVFTLYTGYLGLQWRKVREVGDELKPLQEESKALQAKADALKAQEQSTSAIDAQLREVPRRPRCSSRVRTETEKGRGE